jgi:hypothetical protein
MHDEITKLFRGERLLVIHVYTILRCVKTEGSRILQSSKDPFRGHRLKPGKPFPPPSPPRYQRYINNKFSFPVSYEISAARNISGSFPALLSTDFRFVCSLNKKNTENSRILNISFV